MGAITRHAGVVCAALVGIFAVSGGNVEMTTAGWALLTMCKSVVARCAKTRYYVSTGNSLSYSRNGSTRLIVMRKRSIT